MFREGFGPPPEEIKKFSRDEKEVSTDKEMLAEKEGRFLFDWNKEIKEKFDYWRPPEIAPNGEKVVVVATDESKEYQSRTAITVNGEPWTHRVSECKEIVFSPDSQKIIALAKVGEKEKVLINDEILKVNFEQGRNLQFSPDSQHWGLVVSLPENKTGIIIDGQLLEEKYEGFHSLKINEKGEIGGCLKTREGEKIKVGEKIWPEEYLEAWSFRFASKGDKAGACVKTKEGETVVINEETWPEKFEHCHTFEFSPDGQRAAAIIEDSRGKTIALKEKVWKNRFKYCRDITFNPTNNQEVSVKIVDEQGATLAKDDEVWEKHFENCGKPIYSADGKKMGTWAKDKEGKEFPVIDGEPLLDEKYEFCRLISFSPDNKKIKLLIKKEGKFFLINKELSGK